MRQPSVNGSSHASARRTLVQRLLIPGVIIGAVLRLWVVTWPGTEDVSAFKIWMYNAAHDPTSIYGVGGSPPELRLLHWDGHDNIANYPPLAFDELGVAGRLYRLYSPAFADSDLLTALVKLPPLAAEVAFVALMLTWGRRRFGADVAAGIALVAWLNPTTILDGAVLGYLDLNMTVPAVLSLVAIFADAPAAAGAMLAAAILTKPQPIFLAPVIAAGLLVRHARGLWRTAMAFAAGGLATTTAILAPLVLRGSFWNMYGAVRRLAMYDMLSAQQANVWWLFTYYLRVVDVWQEWGGMNAIKMRLRILAISRVEALGYPNPRLIGFALVGLVIAAAAWRMRRVTSLAAAAALTGWAAWGYAVFATQAHENHLFLAVPFFALAAALDRRYRAVCALVSAITFINLYLFGGFGLTVPPIDRLATGIDASVLLAVVSVVGFVLALIRHLSQGFDALGHRRVRGPEV
jgi:hypothetical protein